MLLGISHHLGWAVAVVADDGHRVADRRRLELIRPDLPPAPIHHEGGAHELHRTGAWLDDDELEALVDRVQASIVEATVEALDGVQAAIDAPIDGICLRTTPDDLPTDIATLRRPPHESRVDSYRYVEVLAADARRRGWWVHRFDPKTVEADAADLLGDRSGEVLHGPREELGPPWTKDHRLALAATVVASRR